MSTEVGFLSTSRRSFVVVVSRRRKRLENELRREGKKEGKVAGFGWRFNSCEGMISFPAGLGEKERREDEEEN